MIEFHLFLPNDPTSFCGRDVWRVYTTYFTTRNRSKLSNLCAACALLSMEKTPITDEEAFSARFQRLQDNIVHAEHVVANSNAELDEALSKLSREVSRLEDES